ncbi:LOW QUALITY PROTEIN: AGGF1 isoform 2, partial [Pan troglodytes]
FPAQLGSCWSSFGLWFSDCLSDAPPSVSVAGGGSFQESFPVCRPRTSGRGHPRSPCAAPFGYKWKNSVKYSNVGEMKIIKSLM